MITSIIVKPMLVCPGYAIGNQNQLVVRMRFPDMKQWDPCFKSPWLKKVLLSFGHFHICFLVKMLHMCAAPINHSSGLGRRV